MALALVRVARTATVVELKKAVEDVFIQSPKDRHLIISRSHVWGNFCVSHKGHKLVDDKIHIHFFGIKDGDQVNFVQHLSTNYNLGERQIKHRSNAFEQLVV